MSERLDGEWHELKFEDLCQRIVNGGTPATDEPRFWGGETPWVTGADFTPKGIGEIRRFVSEAGVQSSATSIVKAGNLLVVTRTGVGKLAIAPFDIAISQDVTGVYIDADKAETAFVFHLLSQEIHELKKLNQGTSINGIVRSDLESHVVRIPVSKAIQRKIASILTRIDTAIEKTEALIEKYQHIKAGLMHDLFTRGVLPNGQLRPPRELAPELYQETEIGWIPLDWRAIPLEASSIAVIDGDRGENYPQGHELIKDGYCVFLSATNVTRDGFRFDSLQFINKEKHLLLGTGLLERGDIVITTRGTVGNIAYFDDSVPFDIVRINSGMVILRSAQEGLNTEFLYSALKNYVFIREYMRVMSGSAQPQLPIKDFKKFNILIPSKAEQRLIVNRVDSIDEILRGEQRKLKKLFHQKAGLMQDLLTGKVQVNSAPDSGETARKAA